MSEQPSEPGQGTEKTALANVSKRILIVCLVVLAGVLVGWIGRGVATGIPADSAQVTFYQNWRVICPERTAKDKSCRIVQEVVDEKTGQTQARIAIANEKGKKTPSLFLTVPLRVLLEPGVGLRLGADPVKTYPFQTCVEEGCVAIVPFDKNMEKSLLQAQVSSLSVASPQDGTVIDMPFSMKGFQEAHSAYLNGEAKLRSWFWRLWL